MKLGEGRVRRNTGRRDMAGEHRELLQECGPVRRRDVVRRLVLVAEGGYSVRALLNDEKKKMERFAPGVPVHELVIGNEDNQVSVRKLERRLKKLPKKLSAHQMRELRMRLKAVGGMSLPIPKGPMPKGVKIK